MTRRSGPQRGDSSSDHWHPEYWTTDAHHRFEDRVSAEIKELEMAIDKLTYRVTMMLGGLTLIALILPVLAPFMRAILGLETPSGQ